MQLPDWTGRVETPCYVVEVDKLRRNCALLADVQQRAGCSILLALKGFATWATFPHIREYLAGTCASGLHEALLGHQTFGKEVHVFSPAYKAHELDEILKIADKVIFNSFQQWDLHRAAVEACGRDVQVGLRVNPEYSEVAVQIYNPCAPRSRLGILRKHFESRSLDGISGLHFHTLCEQNSDTLARTLPHVEEKFSEFFGRLQWVNFGGGHHITRPDYDVDLLVRLIRDFRARWGLEVILEPGEAIALGTGVLIATVLDVVENHGTVAILDTSASAHMPDVLEMPYRPEIVGAGKPGEKPHDVRLAGPTCLAGDVIGDYSFDEPLRPGDRIVLQDMAHYTMVKNTTFNGVKLPDIALYHEGRDAIETVRRFGYEDYKMRLS